MIVDCHTHIWESEEQLGRGAGFWETRSRGRSAVLPKAGAGEHIAAAKPVDKTFVLAFKSHYLKADIPNDYVAGHVRRYADRLIGFASVDPSRPDEAISELRRACQTLGMKGMTVSPAAQDFHPASTGAMRVYAEAARLRVPVIFHPNCHASPAGKMAYARPFLLDEVAREFPDLKIVVSQLGYPWVDETITLIGKHRNVFADISGLLHHAWLAYQALLVSYQQGVMDLLLFGSNFPYSSPAVCIETLYSINQFCHGTNLPTIPREQLRQIVERNTLELLGIDDGQAPSRIADTTLIRAED